jgi:curved DNA-binding protein
VEYKDYYRILGVDRDAKEREIKRAYRKLAREYHPDVNKDPGAEERFKEINEAYQVLSDAENRRKYDQLGSAYREWGRGGGRPGDFDWSQWVAGSPGGQRVHVRYGSPDDFAGFGDGNPFSDFFSQIFGGFGQAAASRGQDLEQVVEISLDEAYHGTTRLLQKNGRRLSVKIPAGSATGTRVRMAGEGAPGSAGGSSGDLYLRVQVSPDTRFERQGDDLVATVPIDLYTAVLGGTAQVETISGTVQLTIPPGTQNGQTFRLRGKGMPRLRQPEDRGDLYARVQVQLPVDITARQQELFEELRRLAPQ